MTACRIDDRLGSASGRFFGEGYKGVVRQLTDIEVAADVYGRGEIYGTAGLSYSDRWSTKGNRTLLRPHLSTPDGLLLAVNLIEAYLVHTYALSDEERRQMWVTQLAFRAGARPQEELAGFGVSAVHDSCSPATDSRLGHRSTFRCRIGAMTIGCVIEHCELRGRSRPARYATAEHILGEAATRHYGTGYQAHRLTVDEVDLDSETGCISASITGVAERRGANGLEAAYPLSMSMLDGMVALVQLAQVLIYEVDGLERSSSNTLWMRRAVMSRRTPDRPIGRLAPATVAIENARSLRLGGATWRTFDMLGEFGEFRATAALAHQLPVVA